MAYAKGMEEALNSIHAEYIYHEHTDDCYETQILTCTAAVYLGGTFKQHCGGCQKDWPDETAVFRNYTIQHSSCGASASSGSYCTEHSSAPSSSTHSYTKEVCICGKTEDTIEQVIISME